MDGGASGQRLRRRKTGKTAAEWQLPVLGLASTVADVLSEGGQGRRWCRRRWLMGLQLVAEGRRRLRVDLLVSAGG